jgi:hypothetical protein
MIAPSTASRSPRRWSRRNASKELWLITGLLLLGVALPLVVGAVAGSLELPRYDDWSYRRIALDLARTGSVVLDGISETMIIGQILVTQPLLWLSGFQPWAFTVAGVVFATAGILGAYAMARGILSARDATIAAGLLAVFPGYLAYATSYMSDVPALAAEFTCLALGMVAIRSRTVLFGWLLASAAVGVFAFSIREFAVAAPASVLLAAIAGQPRSLRVLGLALAVGTCCVGIHLWRTSLPGQLPALGPGYGAPFLSVQAMYSVALVVAPAALIGAIRWRPYLRRLHVVIGLEIGVILAGAHVLRYLRDGGGMPRVILDNLFSPRGNPTSTLESGGLPLLFPEAVWSAVNGLALVTALAVFSVGVGIAGVHWRRTGRSLEGIASRLGSPLGIVLLFSVLVMGGLLAFSLSRPVYDRYFWPLVPPVAVLFLYLPGDMGAPDPSKSDPRVDRLLRGSATFVTFVLAGLAGILLLNSHALDAARWAAGQRLVGTGLASDQIDAGFEWVGFHATSLGDPTRPLILDPFYRSWWPEFTACGVVSAEPLTAEEGRLVDTIPYELNLIAGPSETLYLYRTSSLDCPE